MFNNFSKSFYPGKLFCLKIHLLANLKNICHLFEFHFGISWKIKNAVSDSRNRLELFCLSLQNEKENICRAFLIRFIITGSNMKYFHLLEEGMLLLFLRKGDAFGKIGLQ